MPHADPLGAGGVAQIRNQRFQPAWDLGGISLEAAQGAEYEVARTRGLPPGIDDDESQGKLGVREAVGRGHEIGRGLVLVKTVPTAIAHTFERLGKGFFGAQAARIAHGHEALPNRAGHQSIRRITGAEDGEGSVAQGPGSARGEHHRHTAAAEGNVGATSPAHGASRSQRQQHGVIGLAAREHELRFVRDESLLLPEDGACPPRLGAGNGHALLDVCQERREPHAIFPGNRGFLVEIERDHHETRLGLAQVHGGVHFARTAWNDLFGGRCLAVFHGGCLPRASGRKVGAARLDLDPHAFHQGLFSHEHIEARRGEFVRPYCQLGRRGPARERHGQAHDPLESRHW